MTAYEQFLATKRLIVPNRGVDVRPEELPISLFGFQRALVTWSLRKGRAAILATTGMGKTACQLAFAERAADRALVIAPLAVAHQTVREGEKFGIQVTYARSQVEAPARGIVITNYQRFEQFDPAAFGAVILDESSILKDETAVTRGKLIAAFRRTPMRLCCTATAAPNDIAEIANHAEFLGVMTRAEMLAAFFVHTDEGWRLKGHAREPFYRWLSSWGMSLLKPSDIGYSDDGYELPPLSIEPVILPTDYAPPGKLFADRLQGVTERAAVRRDTVTARCEAAAALIAAEPDEQWLVWCGLNEESQTMARIVPGAVEVKGSDDADSKAEGLLGFAAASFRVLVTKPGIAAHGLNLQSCARMVFVGLGDSYEQYFQCLRRCWRYGQNREVKAWIVLTEPEICIFENVLKKEEQARVLSNELVRNVREFEREELTAPGARDAYAPSRKMRLPCWMSGSGAGSISGGSTTVGSGQEVKAAADMDEYR